MCQHFNSLETSWFKVGFINYPLPPNISNITKHKAPPGFMFGSEFKDFKDKGEGALYLGGLLFGGKIHFFVDAKMGSNFSSRASRR